MKEPIAFIPILFLALTLNAQTIERAVIGSAGGYSANGISLGYTIGETRISHDKGLAFHWNEGFQQGEYDPSIVPVELITFSAERSNDEVAILGWETASEINNKGFHIERKNHDEEEFSTVGFVNGAIQSTERKTYSFTDSNSEYYPTYYRLKQEDLDGSYTYTELRVVPPIKKNLSVTLDPNPSRGDFSIQLQSNFEMNAIHIEIWNLNGETVHRQENMTISSPISIKLNEEIPSGIYILQVSSASIVSEPIQWIKL